MNITISKLFSPTNVPFILVPIDYDEIPTGSHSMGRHYVQMEC